MNDSDQVKSQVGAKVQSDTEERLARFQEMRRDERKNQAERKIKFQPVPAKRGEKKELSMGEAQGDSLGIFQSKENFSIVFALGMTIALVNDFFDLVTWQKISLISQTIDMTALILLLLVLMFASRAYFLTIFIVLFAFMLEILPVIGVLPWWTIGIAACYWANRSK